jgi:hypothetical protein
MAGIEDEILTLSPELFFNGIVQNVELPHHK